MFVAFILFFALLPLADDGYTRHLIESVCTRYSDPSIRRFLSEAGLMLNY